MGVETRVAPVAVALAVALGASVGARADKNQLLVGRRLFRQVEYRRAITALTRALAGRLGRSEKIEATLLLAKSHHALDRPGDAMAAFRSLLRLSPDFRLSPAREPPSLVELFERARSSVRPARREKPPTIQHIPVRRALSGRLLRIVARVSNRRPGHRVRVYYRRIGQLRYEARDMVPGSSGVVAAVLDLRRPGGSAQEYLLEYYLGVTGALGERLAQVGSAERPLRIRVTAALSAATRPVAQVDKPTPWYKRYWWIWVAVGAVVVGGAVGGALAAR